MSLHPREFVLEPVDLIAGLVMNHVYRHLAKRLGGGVICNAGARVPDELEHALRRVEVDQVWLIMKTRVGEREGGR